MSIFDGLPDPSAPAQAFMTGLAHGKAEQQKKALNGALSAYAMNPNASTAAAVAPYDAKTAIELAEIERKRAADSAKATTDARAADLQRRAAAGDRSAMAELAGVNIDAYDKLSDNARQDLHNRVDAIGNAALDIASRPPEQRALAWDAYIDQLAPQYPELAPLKGQYSEERLNAAIAQAGQTKEHLDSLKPHFVAAQQGAPMVDVNNPAAIVAYNQSVGGALPQQTKVLGGKTYHQIGGKWYEGDAGGDASGGFPQ